MQLWRGFESSILCRGEIFTTSDTGPTFLRKYGPHKSHVNGHKSRLGYKVVKVCLHVSKADRNLEWMQSIDSECRDPMEKT